MRDREYNLLDEPWIKMLANDGTMADVSLTEAIINAHNYKDLCGELPSQDVAILRLMLAVLYTVLSRSDENAFENERAVKEYWKKLWQIGKFPELPIRQYFDTWYDRFWLFDCEKPFYQVPNAADGTEYSSAKLNGELSESNNKLRLFPSCSGKEKNELTYAEAARWLLHVNAFDDTSAKPKGKNLPSPGAGWLGKTGLIYAVGNNFFETLMLNLTFLKDGKDLWDEDAFPVWERESVKSAERTEIPVPRNPAELLTLQSRRLLLRREDDKVIGYSLLGGDFFSRSGAFAEQMTVWSTSRKSERLAAEYMPKRHDPSKQFWREFGNVFCADNDVHRPGIVCWQNAIEKYAKAKSSNMSSFRIVSVQYGDKDFFVNDTFSDQLTLHTALITDLGKVWQQRIIEEINKCEMLAEAIAGLDYAIAMAAGGEKNTADVKAQFYDRIDRPFRMWLRDINPEIEEEAEAKLDKWQKIAKKTAFDFGEEIVSEAGAASFSGRYVEKKGKNDSKVRVHYSSPEAYNIFAARVYKIYKN